MSLIKYSTMAWILMSLLISPSTLTGQRSCGMQEHMDQLLSDPEYAAEREKVQAEFEIFNAENERTAPCSAANKILVPMAVHYQNAPSGATRACLVALAQDQIRILNEDYQGINADISDWAANVGDFPAGTANGESCIEFCLPTMGHPTGFGIGDGDVAVTINQVTNDFDANWSGYINIFVRNISALGYSPFPGNGNGNGVTIDNNAFGTTAMGCTGFTASAPYNLGRTLTHELGHYLNLDHIWGNGCNIDDGIADTPQQQTSYGGCPANPSSSCGSNDMHMNYMDYVFDRCMYMFSANQVTRMENWVNSATMANVRAKGQQVCSASSVCPPFLNETANIGTGTQQIEAINYITSESDITGSANIQYNAGDYIELKQGFVAASPANFCAIIQACVPFTSNDDTNNLNSDTEGSDRVLSGQRIDSSVKVGIEHNGGEGTISIYNVEGEKLIADQTVSADDKGMVNFKAEVSELNTDQIYYYILKNGNSQQSGKFMILKED